jgi:hypothetical protein
MIEADSHEQATAESCRSVENQTGPNERVDIGILQRWLGYGRAFGQPQRVGDRRGR